LCDQAGGGRGGGRGGRRPNGNVGGTKREGQRVKGTLDVVCCFGGNLAGKTWARSL